jgi:preprotein translocase subunit YajC
MIAFSHFLIASAFAQDATADATTAAPGSSIANIVSPQMLMMLAVFGVFYFILIRPQQKKLEEQNKMIKALQRGDRIVTSGGIHGKILKLEDDCLIVEIADNVQIKIDRAQVQGLEAKTQPVAAGVNEEKK